jgi:hypothetical protein
MNLCHLPLVVVARGSRRGSVSLAMVWSEHEPSQSNFLVVRSGLIGNAHDVTDEGDGAVTQVGSSCSFGGDP